MFKIVNAVVRTTARTTAPLALIGLALIAGCTEQPQRQATRYPTLSPREVPPYLKDSILEYTDLSGNEPFPVSGYGLVTHLHGTGGSRVATPVRAAMLKELARHDFGTAGSNLASPEAILNSKDVAIVRVDGFIPVGARSALDHGADLTALEWEDRHESTGARVAFAQDKSGAEDWCTWFDVRVSIPTESDATSLAHGVLYQADLKVGGANPADPGNGRVTVEAQAAGEIFINPTYLLDSSIDTAAARFSRKSGVILAGARVMHDRPLILRLRAPSARASRAIEQRIIDRFADDVDDDLRSASGMDNATNKKVANANDEGVVYVYVPRKYSHDWEHFAGVVRHLYLQGADPTFAAVKARELADAAVKPKAPLQDISYCWEGLGKPALFAIGPLMSNHDPDVQYAAARAAAFLGDPAAIPVLLDIANTPGNRFRVTAVKTLAELPATPRVDRLCRDLLNSDEAKVREQAYELLVAHHDSSIYTKWIKNGTREKFALDYISSSAKPMVYATRQGVPRLAIFGTNLQVETPIIYTAMDQRLTISTDEDSSLVSLFYRGEELNKPATAKIPPSVTELVRTLAGDEDSGVTGFRLGYADIVGIMQDMIDQKRITGAHGQGRLLASFVLQDPPKAFDAPDGERPLIREGNGSRPQSDVPGPNDKPVNDHLLRPTATDHAMGPVTPAMNATDVAPRAN